MSSEEFLRAALTHLISSPEYSDFFESYKETKEIETAKDHEDFLNAFKLHLSQQGILDSKLELTFKLIKEQSNIIRHQKSQNPLFSIDQSRKINDNWIIEFQKDFNQCITGESFTEEIRPRRYKTITEYLLLQGVDEEMLTKVYTKYSEYNHPLVNYQVASVLYNSKNYSQGLPIMKEGIKSIISYPNYYWNSEYGIECATWLIGDLLFLIGSNANILDSQSERIKILKLLFLYMSRYICMTHSNLKSIDFYANRARIVKDNFMDFIGIFPIGVNPDIQYISDMYLAHQTGINNGQPMFSKPFDQFYWDSMKMYRHGSHVPNDYGGYKDIEDRTWKELVKDGEIRSLNLAANLLVEFEDAELNIPNSAIDLIFNRLSEIKKDDTENYLNQVKKKKLGEK